MDLGEKVSIVYWMRDSLYINITNKCTNDCVFCVRNYRDGVYGFNLTLDYEPSPKEILEKLFPLISSKYKEIVFTGFGEPLTRLDDVCYISKEIKSKYPELSIRIDTNGLGELINPNDDVIQRLTQAGVNALSISLNAENREKYNKICKPSFGLESFDAILSFAKKAVDHFSVVFTVVEIPQIDLDTCKEIAEKMNIQLKIRGYSGPEVIV